MVFIWNIGGKVSDCLVNMRGGAGVDSVGFGIVCNPVDSSLRQE